MGNLFSRPPPPPPPPPRPPPPPPRPPTPPPTIKVRKDHYRIEEYSPVELQCDVRNAHACVWTFQKKDHPGDGIPLKDTYKYTIDQERCSLNIRDVNENDQGSYTCRVTNKSGVTASDDIYVEVYSNMEDFKWNNLTQKNSIKTRINDAPFTRQNAGIIMYGFVGAGKSSFINSVKTAMTERISTPAPQGQTAISNTKKISYIKINGLPVSICDIPGFTWSVDSYLDYHNLIRDIILNRVAHGTKYDDWKRDHDNGIHGTGNEGGMQNPKWCVVYVHSCKDDKTLPADTYDIIRAQERRITNLGCQMVILLTKIDKLVEGKEVKEVSKIYRGNELRNAMKELSEKTTIDIMNIYPVQNYSSERKNFINMDILLLNAVRRMLDRLEDT